MLKLDASQGTDQQFTKIIFGGFTMIPSPFSPSHCECEWTSSVYLRLVWQPAHRFTSAFHHEETKHISGTVTTNWGADRTRGTPATTTTTTTTTTSTSWLVLFPSLSRGFLCSSDSFGVGQWCDSNNSGVEGFGSSESCILQLSGEGLCVQGSWNYTWVFP